MLERMAFKRPSATDSGWRRERSRADRNWLWMGPPTLAPLPEADVNRRGTPLNLQSTIMRYSEQSKMVTAAP